MPKHLTINTYAPVPNSPGESPLSPLIEFGKHHAMKSRSYRIFKFLFPVALVLIGTSYVLISNSQPARSLNQELQGTIPAVPMVPVTPAKPAPPTAKEIYIQDFLATEIDGPFDNTALKKMCADKSWTPGLTIKCEAPAGGIGNVRNVFLNCIRYAIEAGATTLITPSMLARSTDRITLQTGTLVPFTTLFDLDHFTATLHGACPKLTIPRPSHSFAPSPNTITLDPKTLATSLLHSAWPAMIAPAGWGNAFRHLYGRANITLKETAVIELKDALFQWPLDYDTPELQHSFGRILRFRKDARRVAAAVSWGLIKSFGGNGFVDYYGAHLRTAEDSKAANWTPYEVQSRNLIEAAIARQSTLIYLASGSVEDTARFIALAAENNITAVTKDTILSSPTFAEERRVMGEGAEEWTWDVKALVDYEVLLRGSGFGGTWESSFAWNLAVRRMLVPADEEEMREGVTFGDARSEVFGPPGVGSYFREGMWP